MISQIRENNSQILFRSKENRNKQMEQKPAPDVVLLKNNFPTRFRIGMDKLTKAFTVYPARGLKGSINSDFYEFLTMGTVPYLIGSATMMAVFNSATKHFPAFDQTKAAKNGRRMALGVLFYGIGKFASKSLVNLPVKWATGIDTQLPYAQVTHQLQENINDYDLTNIEYHKVGESVEFTRWDLLYGNPKDKKDLNKRYSKIAKRMGLGENLNDPDQEVKPIYREVLVKSNLARNFASYLWAATGVALAFQKPWDKYFKIATAKFWTKDFLKSAKVFANSFVESAKELYSPKDALTKIEKHSGKALIGAAAAVTVLGVLNTLHINKRPQKIRENKVLDPSKESVVN